MTLPVVKADKLQNLVSRPETIQGDPEDLVMLSWVVSYVPNSHELGGEWRDEGEGKRPLSSTPHPYAILTQSNPD